MPRFPRPVLREIDLLTSCEGPENGGDIHDRGRMVNLHRPGCHVVLPPNVVVGRRPETPPVRLRLLSARASVDADERNRQAVNSANDSPMAWTTGKARTWRQRRADAGDDCRVDRATKRGIGVRSLRAKAARAARDRHAERLYHCALFRDILWWFTPRGFDSSWRTPAVWSLAREIYQERAFERMTELAESLQAAGCTNPRILAHCRQASPHVRGCWLLDLILGMPPPPGAGPFSDRYSYFGNPRIL